MNTQAAQTTAQRKESVFRVCRQYIRENREGPPGEYIQRATGLDQSAVSRMLRMLRDEARIAFEPGNYKTLQIVRGSRTPLRTEIVVHGETAPAVYHPRRLAPPVALVKHDAAPTGLRDELLKLRDAWTGQIAAIDTVSALFVGKAPTDGSSDALAVPTQATKDELTKLRGTWDSHLCALEVVIAAIG